MALLTKAETHASSSDARTLPPALGELARKRLAGISGMLAVFEGLVWFVSNAVSGDLGTELTQPMQGGPPIAVLVVSVVV